MNRRRFLHSSASGLAGLIAARDGRAAVAAPSRGGEFASDVAVIGGGLGGCAAALAALKAGRSVVLSEATDWVGGQLTSQGVPPDEHPWIEQFGRNASYDELRRRIRGHYRRNYPLTAEARAARHLNPGNGRVSTLCSEPRAALSALTDMLAPFASTGRLTVLLEHATIATEADGDRVRSVTLRDLRTGDERVVVAPYILDATELGDLLELAGVEHVNGFEAASSTGERSAPAVAEPLNQQAITICFPLEHRPGEDHTIDMPAEYGFWRDYIPELDPPWSGPLLGLSYSDPRTLAPRHVPFEPTSDAFGWWTYRRIIDPSNFRPGAFDGSGGVTMVNWPQNDYLLGPLVGVAPETAAAHLDRAKQLSLALVYWLQTACPRADGGLGWPGLRLRPDLVGTADGLAKAPYIRESRRIEAEFTVTENHVGTIARRQVEPDAEVATFPDSVGVGSYRIDLHPSTGGNNYIDLGSLPFEVPLGALIPSRVENLLPACKNLGTTHVANGCYRLHPVEWAIGEAAGSLAAFCLEHNLTPRSVRNTPEHLQAFQAVLTGQGVEIHWPQAMPR